MKTLLLSTIVTLLSCRGEKWDDNLTLPKQDYTGIELRTDGYYYNESDNRYSIVVYYRDGTRLYGGSPLLNELVAREQSYSDGTYYHLVKNSKTNWGRFIINGSEIIEEYWAPSNGSPLDAFTASGIIIDDTTFRMTKSWRSCKPKKVKEFEQVYHFKQFSPKPDSSNTYTN